MHATRRLLVTLTVPVCLVFNSAKAGAEAEFSASITARLELLDMSLLSSGQLTVCFPEESVQIDESSNSSPPFVGFDGSGNTSFFFTPPCSGVEGAIFLSTFMEVTATASGHAEWDGGPDTTIQSGTMYSFGTVGLFNNTPDPLEVPVRVHAFATQAGSIQQGTAEYAESGVALFLVGSAFEGMPEDNIMWPSGVGPLPALRRSTREPIPTTLFDVIADLHFIGQPGLYALTVPPSWIVDGGGATIEIRVWTLGLEVAALGAAASRLSSDGASEPLTFIPEFPYNLAPHSLPESTLVLPLDIKPGSCPNSFNRDSHGVLSVGLLGTAAFDVTTVDLTTVRLSRADCIGGMVAPHEGPPGPHSVISDVGTPFAGQTCGCHELGGDGIPDLSMHFKTDEVVSALELDALSPGALVGLLVTGKLADGREFISRDCIRLVPPNSPPHNMVIRSTAAGAWLDLNPLDLRLDGGGFAEPEFTRTFPETSVVTVTAAPSVDGRPFVGWKSNGVMVGGAAEPIAVTVSGEQALEAVYLAPGDLDADADVDLGDFGEFATCFSGPNQPPKDAGCIAADLDGDTDVDLTDFASFQGCFNGPNRPPACP